MTEDLQARIASRKRDLIAEILEHKKNSSRAGAAQAVDKIKARLTELTHIVKVGVIGGWGNVSPQAKLQLDEWMSK